MIDLHAHINKKEAEEIEALLRDMDLYGVRKRVISTLSPEPILDNIKFIEECVKNHPDKLIGCAVINPKLPSSLNDIKYALNSKEIAMIEFNPVEHAYFPDFNDNLPIIIDEINKKGLPIKIFTGIGCFGIPQQWEQYIEMYPDTKFIFLHMGCFDYGYTCIDVVARHKNAYVELSNQYELQILRKAFSLLENKKILFGTTYPERLTTSALRVLDAVDIEQEKKDNIYFKNNNEILIGGDYT